MSARASEGARAPKTSGGAHRSTADPVGAGRWEPAPAARAHHVLYASLLADPLAPRYVLERIDVLALDETIAMEFMDEIETESHTLFDSSVLESRFSTAPEPGSVDAGGARTLSVDDPYRSYVEGDDEDLLPSKDDIDSRLAKAKQRFEEVVRTKSVDRG